MSLYDYKTITVKRNDFVPSLKNMGKSGWRYIKDVGVNKETIIVLLEKEVPIVAAKPSSQNGMTCECGSPMVKRSGTHGPFYGCSKYPDCKKTKEVDGSISRFDKSGKREGVPF